MFSGTNQSIVATGSGCFIHPDTLFDGSPRNCFLLTCEHVVPQVSDVGEITQIYVIPPFSNTWMAVPLVREGPNQNTYVDLESTGTDIAIVRLFDSPEKSGLDESYDTRFPCLSPSIAEIGDIAYIIGNPAGIDDDSFAGGYVRDNKYLPSTGNHECLSTDIAISGGNSGSSLLNTSGRIIGTLTHGRDNSSINSFTYGPNVDTLRLVIPYIMGTDEYRQSTLKGRYPGVNFIANPVQAQTNPINAINFVGGNAMNIWLRSDNITPQPDWSNAFVTSYDIFMDAGETNKLEEVITGQIIGGNGFTKALFTPNVDHIVLKGYFYGSANVNEYRWPPLSVQA